MKKHKEPSKRSSCMGYLPHDEKFNVMYEEIFSHSRPPAQDLQSARKAAQGRGVVL